MRTPELARQLASRLRAARSRSIDRDGPLGSLDDPAAGEWCVQQGVVRLVGWASPRSGRASVVLRLDGRVVAETVPVLSRPDVAAVHGGDAVSSGWQLAVTLAPVHDGARWSVDAHDDTGTTSLGRGVVRVRVGPQSGRPAQMIGHLDSPLDGQVAPGAVVAVAGWALDGADLADVIEIFVDARPPVLARRCEPRPDVARARAGTGVASGIATAAGFRELLVLNDEEGRDSTLIRVRATGRSGSVWHSGPITVHHVAGPASHLDVARSPFDALPPSRGRAAELPKVCVLTHSLQLGGGELYLQELLLRLAAARVAELRVISPSDGPLRAELESAGIAVHVTTPYAVDPSHYYGRRAELAAVLQAWSCDVALANTLGVFPAVDAALQAGIPVAWAVHESFPLAVFSYLNWGERGLAPEIHERWIQTLLGADVVVFEAESTLELFRSQVPDVRGRCIQYGIDLGAMTARQSTRDRVALRAELGLKPEHRVLLCMGVLQDRKAQLALVEAFAEVAASAPDAVLVLVGYHPTPYARCVQAVVEDLDLSERVHIVDIDPDTERWYRCADVLVSASDIESLPRSMIEALAFGLPVLAADVFGVPEVIDDGATGWLFRARNGQALVAGLRRAVGCSDEELTAMAERCRKRALHFDGSHYARAYSEIIADLAGRATS
ncbi:MAG: hypothetical protein DLM57_12395 [Pseudonocardiales bacterium]|nr:MAG: hypothetical protein DLM57_12395 [Pseudonocardiales bacterium]